MTDASQAPGHQQGPAPSRAAFAFIFVTVLLDMMALGVVIPVLPKLVKAFMNGDTAGAAHVIGYFGFFWALMQFVFQPVLGSLSDRFGRRPVIILSNIGLGLDYVLMALSPNLWFLFVGRLISGITSATYSTAGAYIADVTSPDKRAARFGMLGAALGLGFIIGPAVGGVLGDIDLKMPFWGAAVLSLLNGTYGFFVLPESLSKDRRSPFSFKRANTLGAFRFLGSNPTLARLALASFLQRFAHGSLPSMFVLYADYRYGWDAGTVGWVLAAVGVAQTIVSGGLVRPAIARLGERGTLMLGLTSGAIGFALYGWAPNGTIFLIALPLVALWGVANPAIQSLATQRVGPREQGQLQGATSSLGSVADMLGPLAYSQVFAIGIVHAGLIHLPGAPYYLAALFVIGAMLVCWQVARVYRPEPALAE
jgi:DHA1 family tetracycline resistance protein-like MFS transporter